MKKSVLVVDDEKGFHSLFAFLLEPFDFEVICVDNGRDAIEKIKLKEYDLIFLDVHMPILGGAEAFREIRKIRPTQKFVVFSSRLDPSNTKEQELNEHVPVLFKPVEIQELEAVLNKTIGFAERL